MNLPHDFFPLFEGQFGKRAFYMFCWDISFLFHENSPFTRILSPHNSLPPEAAEVRLATLHEGVATFHRFLCLVVEG